MKKKKIIKREMREGESEDKEEEKRPRGKGAWRGRRSTGDM